MFRTPKSLEMTRKAFEGYDEPVNIDLDPRRVRCELCFRLSRLRTSRLKSQLTLQ